MRTPHPMEMFGEDWMQWCEANGGGNTAERLWGPVEPELPAASAPDDALRPASEAAPR